MTYLQLNPKLLPHDIYSNTHVSVYERKAFTRFRTSSHNLKVETGRWSRISRENRNAQDEEHVIFVCKKTAHIRNKYGITETSLSDLFSGRLPHDAAKIIYETLLTCQK